MTVELTKLEADILLGFFVSAYRIHRKHPHHVALDRIIKKLEKA